MKKKILFICLLLIFIFLLTARILITLIYPNKYSEYVEKYSKEYGVDKNLVYAIMKQESNFKPTVNSHKGAIGLMQLMQNTAREIAIKIDCNDVNLYDPETNIMLGIKHLSDLLEKYDNKKIAIAAYNAGEGNVDKWIDSGIINADGTKLEDIPYKETNMYVRKVLKNYEIYAKLY